MRQCSRAATRSRPGFVIAPLCRPIPLCDNAHFPFPFRLPP